jgi:hypothetical protein
MGIISDYFPLESKRRKHTEFSRPVSIAMLQA